MSWPGDGAALWRIWQVPTLRELPRVKGWTVLRVMLPPFEEIAAADVMARPAVSVSGMAPVVALSPKLMATSRTALSVRVAVGPAVLETATATRMSPLPVAALAVLSVTALAAFSEVWIVV